MKRSLDPLVSSDCKRAPMSSDNSTTTANTTDANHQQKKSRRVAKHLRRGAIYASSAHEYMKSDWTCDELDLTKQITVFSDLTDHRLKLIDELFSVFTVMELKAFTPELLKEFSVNQLKEMCLEELNIMSKPKIKYICGGNDPENYSESDVNHDNNDRTRSQKIGDKTSGDSIQLLVDDNEYSDFLGSEQLQQKKLIKEVKDAEVQANELSLESSSDDEVMTDDERQGEGWRNLFAKTQMQILELEFRARAIRSLMKAHNEDQPIDDTNAQSGQSTNDNQNSGHSKHEYVLNEDSQTYDSNNSEENIGSGVKYVDIGDKSNFSDSYDYEKSDDKNDKNSKVKDIKQDSDVDTNSNDSHSYHSNDEIDREEGEIDDDNSCDK
ncbi:protein starmaker-like [Oppia nitens]|uniref:protein starmaker-like n=1 Tax=Oppia nitens TaxID=1686743 RepID=UPI0023DC3664|nr:protein starmaker-like [Oppia nitens]